MEGQHKHTLVFQIVDDSIIQKLEAELKLLEKTLGIEGFSSALFQVIMELVGNAVKANTKRIYFERLGLNIMDPKDYARGISRFSADYPTLDQAEYKKAMQDLELHVVLQMDLDHQRLLIFVENNTVLVPQEEENIRSRLAGAMDVKDVMEFFQIYGDDSEGRGLGLAMIIFLIKDLGFKPEHFRIFHRQNRTIARMEFPLDATYQCQRDQSV